MVSPNHICSKILFFSVACWNFLRKSVCAAWAFTASFALIKYWLRSAPVLRCALSNAQHACQASVTIPIPLPPSPYSSFHSTPLQSSPAAMDQLIVCGFYSRTAATVAGATRCSPKNISSWATEASNPTQILMATIRYCAINPWAVERAYIFLCNYNVF